METKGQIVMKTDDFDYDLPQDLIAQFPCKKRDDCRLLFFNRTTAGLSDRGFTDLPLFLSAGDRLVFNDTKVIPSRLWCRKESGGAVELLVTEPIGGSPWKALVRSSRRMNLGTCVVLEKDRSIAISIGRFFPDGTREVSLADKSRKMSIGDVVENFGEIALPHYIKRPINDEDRETYQTVFAKRKGAVASPTAGLHFTKEMLGKLEEKGIDTSFVTLHVGMGTFRPVRVDDPRLHPMHEEWYELTGETAAQIEATKKRGGRIIAVGTTVVRVLEQCGGRNGGLCASKGKTDLLILPGYEFKVIDGMITNFHVPRSTLLMLVCAFSETKAMLSAYRHAIIKKYSFFSYGDAMLIM